MEGNSCLPFYANDMMLSHEFGTEVYGYVCNIIRNVYGDTYDAQYKG